MMSEGLSVADAIALTNKNNDGMFGGDGSWFWAIILLALIGGWGGYGFGGFGGNGRGGAGIADNYVLATDFATIERKLDSISNGICDSTFALNNTVVNGFSGVQNALSGLGNVGQSDRNHRRWCRRNHKKCNIVKKIQRKNRP